MAFPFDPTDTRVRLDLDGDGTYETDITNYVLSRDSGVMATIARGMQSEGASAPPSSITLTLNNADGRFTPQDPTGPYSPYLTRNTAIQIDIDNGAGGRDVRATGVIPAWPMTGGLRDDDAEVQIVATDVTRRLTRSATPLSSVYRMAVTASDSPLLSLIGYWPMDDASGASRLTSGLSGGQAASFSGGPQLASDAVSFPASNPLLVSSSDTYIRATVPQHTYTGRWQVMFMLGIPSTGIASERRILRLWVNSSVARQWSIYLSTAGELSLEIRNEAAAVVLSGSWTTEYDLNGKNVRFYISAQQSGSGIAWTFSPLTVGANSGGYVSGTLASAQLGNVESVTFLPETLVEGVTLGELTYQSQIQSLFALYKLLDGYTGEGAPTRIERLCGEAGIPVATVGSDVVPLGPQRAGKLLDILREAETSDGGVLYAPRGTLGLAYRAVDSLDAQVPSVECAYATSGVTQLVPVTDDQQIRNRIVATRTGGSSITVEDASGALSTQDPPDGVGLYESSLQVSLESDARLLDRASWDLLQGTAEDQRYTSITFDLAAQPFSVDQVGTYDTLRDSIIALDVGDRVVASSPPAWAGPDDVDQIAIGVVEELGQWTQRITAITRPYGPYRTATWDETEARYSGEGTTVAAPAAAGSVVFAGDQTRSYPATQQAGDLIVSFDVTLDSWASEQAVVARYDNASGANERSWAFVVTASGRLQTYLSIDGATSYTYTSTATHGFTSRGRGRFHYHAITGDVDFYTSTDFSTWVQLGTSVSGSAVGGLYDADADFQVGARSGTGLISDIVGTLHAVQINDGEEFSPIPTRDNTGADTSVSMTTVTDNVYIDSGPVDYVNTIFEGSRVRVRTSAAVTFTNCIFLGNSALTSEHGLLDCTHADVASVVATNCTFQPTTPTAYMTGVLGHHFHLNNCLIRHCVDGVGVYNTAAGMGAAATGVVVDECWIGDHAWFYPDPGHADGSHGDGVQFQGGAGTVIRNTVFEAYNDTTIGDSPWSRIPDPLYRATSVMMFSPNVGDITGTVVENCWFSGGEFAVNLSADNAGNNVGQFTGNKTFDNFYYADVADWIYTHAGITYSESGTQVVTAYPTAAGGALLAPTDLTEWTDGYDGVGTGSTILGESAGSLVVTAPLGCAWAHDDGDYAVRAGREVMTVTGVSGSWPLFVLSVTRGVNGVIEDHPTGQAIDVATPARYGL